VITLMRKYRSFTEFSRFNEFEEVPVGRGDDSNIGANRLFTAQPLEFLVLRNRSNFTCTLRETSPISSRKIVPWPASSNFPLFPDMAPVKAPFSWPNSSLSSRGSGRASS